ncbi:unnamed protein product [Closterium sp. NIES-53]
MGTRQRRQQRQQEIFSPHQLRNSVSQRGIPGSVEAAALGASESAAALGASESATALGDSASTATGPASAEALHILTLDSGASCCFFRDCTTVTPLATPIPVSLADPTGGSVVERASSLYTLTIASAQVPASDSPLAPPTRSPLSAASAQHALPSPCLWPSQVSAPPPALACPAVSSLGRGAAARCFSLF